MNHLKHYASDAVKTKTVESDGQTWEVEVATCQVCGEEKSVDEINLYTLNVERNNQDFMDAPKLIACKQCERESNHEILQIWREARYMFEETFNNESGGWHWGHILLGILVGISLTLILLPII